MRFFFGFPPILFYAILRDHKELREALNLKVLKTFSNYEDFRKKLHRLKVRINSIIKRNIATITTVDLNRLRNGKKIKNYLTQNSALILLEEWKLAFLSVLSSI